MNCFHQKQFFVPDVAGSLFVLVNNIPFKVCDDSVNSLIQNIV